MIDYVRYFCTRVSRVCFNGCGKGLERDKSICHAKSLSRFVEWKLINVG